ncbi:poly [ADP-ribose] polymerase tankyrase-like isoform X1 [Lytechinus variegatus]|uniref:poly [ADP-ribose] polymerase tankyrase-like isoform X1 n=2 Tax=Lytechinus variegatus TaxID=7654 RepID=UPI001BB14AC3|nr:poly [ADP-ribose] polymerase tankyrase-like isoform X1 [Lytechinus variegatus]
MTRGMWLRRSSSRSRKRRKMADDQEASTSSAPPKKRSSPAKSDSSQRSPNVKRKRTQADRYQSDVVEAFSKPSKTRTPASAKKEVYFGKGAYLAVRSDAGFFLCQSLKIVYDISRKLAIQWLEETKPGIYKMSFLDFVDRDSVLTQVQLRPAGEKGLKKLPETEISRIDKIINISVKKEKGQLSEADGRASLDQLSEQIANSKGRKRKEPATPSTPARPKPTPNRRRKVPTKTRAVASKILKSAKDRSSGRKKAAAKAKKKAIPKGRAGKKKDEKVAKGRGKLDPNRKLVPNNKIELVSKDPMFEVKNENSMPEVSKVVQCKRAIRAVLTNDMPLLKQLLTDTKRVPSVFLQRSVAVPETALGYAIKSNSQPFIRAFLNELKSNPSRCEMPVHSLTKENTGSYNYRSLGHAVRAINVSRGGREGQDAFLKDSFARREDDTSIAHKLTDSDVSMTTMDLICKERQGVKNVVCNDLQKLVRRGNRKVAGELFKRQEQEGGHGFNRLHSEVLLCDKPEELTPFKAVSVKKKPYACDRIMPIHCAAINPNPKILEKLLNTVPELNLADTKGKKIIHYAAACTGSGPLELLIQRSAFADDTDNQGNTPLMVAASLNRTQNIEVLVKKLKSDEKGGVFRRNTFGQTPLHYAAENGHNDAVRALLKHGANLQATLSAGKNKLTPFMVACERGHLQTVKIMADHGAILDQRDKLKRTPLMLAAINGHVPVAAFLLRKGCDPNASDSSGNSPLHYSAAYGWWFMLRLLLSAGADPNALNDWKVPPLAIAFMKGHVGCADLLLEDSNADVNFRDADGWTIVMLTVSQLTPEMWEQLKYLVEEKNASVTLKDANDWTALHHLAAANFHQGTLAKRDERKKISVDMATFLISKGCDIHAKTSDGETALDIAIKRNQVNADMVKFLLGKGSKLTNFTNEKNENLLHLMAQRCLDTDQIELLNIVAENMKNECSADSKLANDTAAQTPSAAQPNAFIKQLAQARDSSCYTPLLRWAVTYVTYSSRKNEEQNERGRSFLKRLLELSHSDINAKILKKENTRDAHAEKNVLHLLCEMTEKSKAGLSSFPALDTILSYKPDLNARDKDGRTPLIKAVKTGRIALVEKLVKEGANVNLKSQEKDSDKLATPLNLAMRDGHFGMVDLLITDSTVNAPNEPNRLTPFHFVAMSHRNVLSQVICQVMRKLLAKGARIQARDWKGRTPLHYACKTYINDRDPSTDALELLLDNKADVFAEDNEGRLPLHYLFFDMDNPNEKSSIDPIEASSLLKDAMRKQKIGHPDKQGQTPIHAAALRGAIISLMDLADCVNSVDTRDSVGNTPLSMACMGEHISVVIFLLQQGANISATVTRLEPLKDEEAEKARKKKEEEEKTKEHFWEWRPLREKTGRTAMPTVAETLFRRVVKNGWQGILFLLMDRLEKFKVPYITPIKAAIEEHRYQMALNLVSKSRGHKVDGVAAKQQNLLHILALQPADQLSNKVAEKLLSKGVSLTHDQFKCTPLTYAVLSENIGLAKFLWGHMKQQGGKQALTSTDVKGRNLLATAFWRREYFDTNLVSWLVEVGASLNVAFPVPLWETEGRGAETIPADKLEEWFHHREDHPVGYLTPLLAALRVASFDRVKFLLTKGADPNLPAKDMLTPLMCAVRKNNLKLVKLLLNYDYDPAKDSNADSSSTKTANPTFNSLGSFGVSKWKSGGPGLFNGDDAEMDEDEEEEDEIDEENEDEENEDDENEDEDAEMDENGDEENEDDEEEMDHDGSQENGEVSEEDDKEKDKNKPEEKEKPFVKTSNVDLSARDSRGRTVIHHLMCTCDFGTYQNKAMLNLFHSLGVPLDTKDGEGKSPLDYALEAGSHVMAELLQRLQGIKKPQMQLPTLKKSTWTDGYSWAGEPSIDFREDSRALLTKVKEESEKNLEELPKYPKPKVDKDAQLKEAGEVLMDTEQDIPYDILMTKVDIRYGQYGMNNFYKMQVVFAKGKDMYILLTRWGRIGDSGQFQRTPFGTKEEAVTEFCKIFKAKSGNSWSQVKEFSKHPGKYNLVRTDPYFDRRTVKNVEFNLKSDKPSKLHSGTQKLLQTLTSPSMLKHAMKQCGASEKYLPFGHLQREVLDQASKKLQEIQDNIKKLEKATAMNERIEIYDKMAALSSDFYMLVPNDSFTHQSMEPINDANTVETLMQHLADMADLELTGNLMLGAQHRVADMNPLDYIYRCLDCEIVPLEEDDVMAQLILQQIYKTKDRQQVNVQRIYRVRRKGEEDTLASCNLDNHKLLWHGTKPFNILSILRRGLIMTPIGVPITGMRYGSGIYHADMFTKSSAYADSYGADFKSRFLFVDEVALGNMQTEDAELKKGFNSLKSLGHEEPNPNGDLLLPTGAVLPLGNPARVGKSYGWGHNEFVVYKENQVCLRYLVQVQA